MVGIMKDKKLPTRLENNEVEIYECSKCNHLSFTAKCWSCLNHNKFPKMNKIRLRKITLN